MSDSVLVGAAGAFAATVCIALWSFTRRMYAANRDLARPLRYMPPAAALIAFAMLLIVLLAATVRLGPLWIPGALGTAIAFGELTFIGIAWRLRRNMEPLVEFREKLRTDPRLQQRLASSWYLRTFFGDFLDPSEADPVLPVVPMVVIGFLAIAIFISLHFAI